MLILFVKSKKAIFKESFKTNLSQGWSRSRNSDLRLRGAGVGAERKNVGSTTLLYFTLPTDLYLPVPRLNIDSMVPFCIVILFVTC